MKGIYKYKFEDRYLIILQYIILRTFYDFKRYCMYLRDKSLKYTQSFGKGNQTESRNSVISSRSRKEDATFPQQ